MLFAIPQRLHPAVLRPWLLVGVMLAVAGCRTPQHFVPPQVIYNEPQPAADAQRPVWLAPPTPYRPSVEQVWKLLHTDLDLAPEIREQTLTGTARLWLTPWAYGQQQVVLDAKGMSIAGIEIEGKPAEFSAFTLREGKLNLALNRIYLPGDTLQLTLRYTARPNELNASGSEAISGAKGLYFINPTGEEIGKPVQFWTQGEPEAASCWFPTLDAPNQRSSQRLRLTVPDSLVTISNGRFVGSTVPREGYRTDEWEQKLNHAPYLFMMAAGRFARVCDKWRDKEVCYYVEPQYERYARMIFGNTPEMLDFFSRTFGLDYPWDKYAQVVVRDFVSGAMENTSATIHMGALQHDARAHLDETQEDYVSHELTHQWFGDWVTCESWGQLPLNESFATYGEYLWKEYKYGPWEAQAHLHADLLNYLGDAEEVRHPLVRYSWQSPDDMFDTHSYQKGGRILHLLRLELGDAVFFGGIRKYLNDNALRPVEIHHLRLAMEAASGRDLKQWFDQWIFSPGHPELRVSYPLVEGKQAIRVEQLQNTSFSPLYQLPLRIRVDLKEGGQQSFTYRLASKDTTWTLTGLNAEEVVNICPDAEGNSLWAVEEAKPLEWRLHSLQKGKTYREIHDALASLTTELSKPAVQEAVLAVLANHPFWAVRREAVETLDNLEKLPFSVTYALENAVRKDANAKVRVRALRTLARVAESQPQVKKLYWQMLQDSSYAVVAQALTGVNTHFGKDSVMLAVQTLRNANSSRVQRTVAEILLEQAAPDAVPYTLLALNQMDPSLDKLMLITRLGKALPQADSLNRETGLKGLIRLTDDHSWFLRMAAVSGLLAQKDHPLVKERLALLRKRESHPRVKALLAPQD